MSQTRPHAKIIFSYQTMKKCKQRPAISFRVGVNRSNPQHVTFVSLPFPPSCHTPFCPPALAPCWKPYLVRSHRNRLSDRLNFFGLKLPKEPSHKSPFMQYKKYLKQHWNILKDVPASKHPKTVAAGFNRSKPKRRFMAIRCFTRFLIGLAWPRVVFQVVCDKLGGDRAVFNLSFCPLRSGYNIHTHTRSDEERFSVSR